MKKNEILEKEIEKLGYRYEDNEDGTYTVCYDHKQDGFFVGPNKYHTATIRHDDKMWYIDNGEGLGEGMYSKEDWTLAEAIKDQCIDEYYDDEED